MNTPHIETSKDSKELNMRDFTADQSENTNRLMSIPGLAETVALQVGNAIFIPHGPEDVDQPWQQVNITVDDKPVILFKAHECIARTVYPIPVSAFNTQGLQLIFKHEPPPAEFVYLMNRLTNYEQSKLSPSREGRVIDADYNK